MSHSFNTTPYRILFTDDSFFIPKKDNRKEYAFGKVRVTGPGGLTCNCCNPRFGYYRDSNNKPKMRRYVRRVSKMNMVKEIAAEMEAIRQEWDDLMDELAYDYDDYDYYDPWDMYCYQMAEDDYDNSFYEE